ncbi:MAG: sugar phosphate isomerase/epimerase [Clostridia bacterium]|nr:sugar phosphate isomerase/epimerase [Clostridia bacterium]
MNSFKLGLCSVTFRKKSVAQVVQIAKKAGIGYIEWGGDIHVKSIEDARIVKSICDNEGIKISSYGSYFNSLEYDEAQWTEICEIAEAMGASSIRIWLGKKDSEETSDREYNTLLKNTKKMCDIAKKYSLLVCPECHDNTFNNNTDAFLRIRNDLKKDNFKTYFQSRYCRMEYDLDRIDRTFDFIENIHVSYRDLKKEQMFKNKDKYYIDKLLDKLSSKGFDGIVMVEFVDFDSESVLYKDVEKLRSH